MKEKLTIKVTLRKRHGYAGVTLNRLNTNLHLKVGRSELGAKLKVM